MAVSRHMKHVAKPCFSAPFVHVNSCIEQHGVMAQRSVRIPLIDAVVDQQRPIVFSRNVPAKVDCRVLMESERGLQPYDNRTRAVR